MKLDRSWFIQSREGNIKDQYFFEKKLGSGGYGAVYLARNKQTGLLHFALIVFCSLSIYHRLTFCHVIGVKVAVKAMQKGKITDYEAFQNEINILMQLVSSIFH